MNIKSDSTKKNYIFQLISQIGSILTPLIIYPYLSRVLNPSGLGELSYTNSIIYYFLAIANLGIVNYGAREIAKKLNNRDELSACFWSIYYCHLLTTVFSLVLFIIFTIFFSRRYFILLIFQSIQIIAAIFDISWFFAGIQKMVTTAIVNSILKIFLIIFSLLLVKNSNDAYLYVALLGISNLISHLYLWKYLKKYVDYKKISLSIVKKHIKPLAVLSLPVVATVLYKYMDKIMIENMSNTVELGLYEAAEKIIAVPLGAITTMGVVLLPKMTKFYSDGKLKEFYKINRLSMKYSMILAIGLVFGILSISNHLMPIYFGADYKAATPILYFLSITILFTTWSNNIRSQYLIPKSKDKEYIISIFLGAFVNVVLNIIFIPKYNSLGAVIGTIVSELLVAIIYSIFASKELELKKYIVDTLPFVLNGILMFMILKFISVMFNNDIIMLLSEIIIGAIIYLVLSIIVLIITKDSFLIENYEKINRRWLKQ